jgi:hypothetical protein
MMRNRTAALTGFLLFAARTAYAAARARASTTGEPEIMFLVGVLLVALASMRNKSRHP